MNKQHRIYVSGDKFFPSCTLCGRILLKDEGICYACKNARSIGYRAGVEKMRDAVLEYEYPIKHMDVDNCKLVDEIADKLLEKQE